MVAYSFFTPSVLGMMTQSYAMGVISTNVANMNTGGYRATEARFSTVVSDTLFQQSDLGGVRPFEVTNFSSQGNMISSARNMDIAINGRGFFMLSPTLDSTTTIFYGRDGSMEMSLGDEVQVTADDGNTITTREGYLADKNGYYVLGWPVQADGTFDTSGTPEPMRVDQYSFTDQGEATTTADLVLNIPATATDGDVYTYSIDVWDSNGVRKSMDLQFTKREGTNEWDFDIATGASGDAIAITPALDFSQTTGTEMVFSANAVPGDGTGTITVQEIGTGNPVTFSNLAVGDSINISGTTNNNGTFTVTAINGGTLTVSQDVVAEVDNDGANLVFSASESYVAGTETVIDTTARTITVRQNGGGTNVANAFEGLSAGDTITLSGTPTNDGTYTIASVSNGGATITLDAATPLPGVDETDVDGTVFSASGVITQPMTFGGDGYFSTPADGYSTTITWADGATNTVAFDFSSMSQFGDSFSPTSYSKNGYGAAEMQGVKFDQEGNVLGIFNNTSDRQIYKIALAAFTNPNGLEAKNGNLFVETELSGEPYVTQAGAGAGLISPNTLESSNVDIADEFSRMIITQHAYSSSATAFKTADEMTEVARDLKR